MKIYRFAMRLLFYKLCYENDCLDSTFTCVTRSKERNVSENEKGMNREEEIKKYREKKRKRKERQKRKEEAKEKRRKEAEKNQ